ncbi:MAG: HNH endonuclease [Gemmatimonadales bacterium]|nr:HNH endonuclease [Gemmatimonadales bacterium]
MSPRRSVGEYPPDWEAIAARVKEEAGGCCLRCGVTDAYQLSIEERDPGAGLTVHHADLNPANNVWWNLLALCQRCHLSFQARVVPEQAYLWEHSAWFKPFAAGYYASTMGLRHGDRGWVEAHMVEILINAQGKHVGPGERRPA